MEWLQESLGQDIFNNKYRYEGESLDSWFNRVSGGDKELEQLIRDKKFLFGGRILAHRGVKEKVTYSNCYVLPKPQDNIESIFETAKQLARTFSYGGGVGIDLSNLRPKGAKVNNSAKETSGAVSFMDLYSLVTGLIGQNGRRGALMLSMSVNHPDIEEFIDVKKDLDRVTKANISVRVTSDFMIAVKNDEDFLCEFVTETGETIKKTVRAKDLFMKLCENNWDYAEPGILYWDSIENWNFISEYDNFKYEGVNPCAEEPLPAGGSCNLGALNLSAFVLDPFTSKARFDTVGYVKAVRIATRALNDVLDEGEELHPLQVQRDTVKDWRQIGLGVMGIADMLIKLGMTYGSPESLDFCEGLAKILLNEATYESSLIAKEKGSFNKFDCTKTLMSPFVFSNLTDSTKKAIEENGLRNSQLLTIAPTGSISTMLGISGGIEPIFSLAYTRKTESLHKEGDVYYTVVTPIVKEYLESRGLKVEDFKTTEELLDFLPEYFVTSQNLNPMDRVDFQGVWQQYIDASISSTVNLPNEATVEDVYNIYMRAYDKGLKGITVYRDMCKRSGILLTKAPEEEADLGLARGEMKPIADDTIYYKRKVYIGCGEFNLFIGYSEEEGCIQDLYMKKSGKGGCEKNIETTVIGMSGMLRLGGTLEQIEESFQGISTCASFTGARKDGKPVSKGNYCGNAILNTVKAFMKEVSGEAKPAKVKPVLEPKVIQLKEEHKPKQGHCPECKEPMSFTGGCDICLNCGFTHCS